MAALLVAFVLQVPFARGTSVLQPLSVERPDEAVFPLPEAPRHLPPFGTEVTGAKATNKFWANWVVEEGRELSIHPMPYVLRYDESTGSPNMRISRSSSDERVVQYGDAETNGAEKIRYYFSPFVSEFGLGAIEGAGNDGQVVVKEGLFGIHTEVRGPVGSGRKIVFPIYSGMSYVSGLYSGFTPKITSDRALLVIERVSNGIWRLLNNGGKEFRLYAVDPAGNFADETFDFHSDGRMSSAFEGWIRLAEVQAPEDRAILDFHAPAVLVDWQLDVEHGGAVKYSFTKHAAVPKQILHFAYAHHQKLMAGNAQVVTQLTLAPPTKGLMKGVAGDMWLLQVNQSEAKSLGFLPAGAIDSNRVQTLKEKAYGTLQFFLHSDQWKSAMFRGSYYFSGKGFQKVAYTCLLLEKFYGREHSHTQACANLLIRGFECLYSPRVPECNGAPLGLYYDASWHGVASREGFSDLGCRNADFGNACYNDHHYHFSYFVVSAAVLVKLKPEFSTNQPFVSFVDTLIRDTANPSSQDLHFPTFRSFDWFDLHSWSRGVIPSADGKDQESTSEELNLLYGIQLWGMVLQREPLRELGMTMLSLCATTIREFFLMTEDNPHHPADFVTNHVTGIFFQNKVDYATWFGWRYDFIHGIQMLPVTPAVLMIRTPKFCQQEWDNVLSHLPLSPTDPWTSLLVTGTLAIINPEDAYSRLSAMLPEHMDDGLTHVWALYWSASLSTGGVVSSTTGGPSSTVSVPQEENLALYRLAVASSELSADFGAARAVDGLSVTRWSPSLAEANPWIFIDLGDVRALSHIMVLWGEFYPSSYLIQGKVFETDEWTTLAVSMGSALLLRSDLPQPTFARWVRVVSQSAGDLRLWEFQVFGDADTSVTPPTTALSTTASTMPTTPQSTMTTTSSEAASTTMSTMPETTTTVVTVATSSTVSGPSTTTPFYGPNLAFRKPVLSSSFRSATEHAWKAVDGDAESQWASVDSTDQWLWVDLLGLYAVNRVVILFGDYPPQFVLQTAPDGIRWMDVATATGAHGFVSTEFNPPIITQWLRVICQTACSIQELMVHGNLPGAVTSSTSSTSSLLATSTTEAGTTAPSTTESTGTTGTPTRVNLALNRPTLASSQRLSNEHVSRMVDGVIESQWASASTDAHPWAWVDLLSSYNVREVAVRWGSSVAQYEVQTSSNGVHWTAVAAASGIAGELVRTALPETAAAQWIRIACSSLSPSSSCIIQELYVYDVAGQSGPETTATTAPSAPTTAPTTAEPTTAPMENIALLKPVLSSSQVLPNNFAARAVDGLETTQWTSAPGEQWIWVDLLGRYDLDHVMVSWGSTRPNSFDLETSFNAVNWDVAVPNIVANEGSQRIDVPGAKAQWLRVHCKVATEGCSIQELKVHGTPTSSRMLRGLRKGT